RKRRARQQGRGQTRASKNLPIPGMPGPCTTSTWAGDLSSNRVGKMTGCSSAQNSLRKTAVTWAGILSCHPGRRIAASRSGTHLSNLAGLRVLHNGSRLSLRSAGMTLSGTPIALLGSHPHRPAGRTSFQQRIDQPVYLQGLTPANHRLALFLDRIEEVGDDRAVPIVREGHRIRASTPRAVFGFHLGDTTVVMRHHKIASDKRCGPLLA